MNIVVPTYPPWNGSPAYRDLSVVTDAIVHHSDGALTETVHDIDTQHRAQGWAGIGYHFVIYPDGTINQGRPLDMVPAAAQDDNTHSVDMCLIGDFEPGTEGYTGMPTDSQTHSLRDLLVYLHEKIPTIIRTIGHKDVAVLEHDPSVATACPGHDLEALLPQLREYVAANAHPI